MTRSRALHVLTGWLLSLAALPALAAQTPPPPGPPKDFKLPPHTARTLENGLRTTYVQFGEIPKVTISAIVRVGSLNEGTDTWLADLAGEMLKEGAGERNGTQIALDAAAMGGDVSVSVGADETSVAIDVLSENGPQAVSLIADLLQRPTFPAQDFERIKRDLDRQLALSRTQPQALATEAFLALVYPNHPYGRAYPTKEQLAAYSLEDARNFYGENFGAARTRIYVSGRFDAAAMQRAVESAFGSWTRGPEPLVSPPQPATRAQLKLIDRPDAPQSTIHVGLPVADPSNPDYVPVVVMNSLLGGSFASRITANLRERRGYAYSPSSQLSPHFRANHWVEQADVTTEATGPALKEIFAEIERLRAEAPGAPELRNIQNYRAGIFVLQNSTRGALTTQLSFIDLHGLPEEFLTRYVEHVYALTPANVSDMARRYIRPDAMTIVVVGDLKKIRPQLRQVPQIAPLLKN
jgi:predicted Zn-dependent peptidase